ncbi:hypothetical protein GCM10008090_33970 [Arenicella chitinivorans]|uniref:Uncharacterized protein n=1 Tax=Arenicella chitinivorans TaxID=1329800 RepID=A0A918S284_9GAMM|nr:hypothetical protein [Arenicella chitinivorans]GHA21204.1 hypothetical protein GCM10008090_33970 [Arenicella chitinivorans]
MELSNTPETPAARFKEDVAGVYEHIIRYRAKMNLAADESETPWIKSRLGISTIIVIGIFAVLFAAMYFLPPTVWGDTDERIRLVVQLIVLCVYLMAGGIIAAHYISLKRMFTDIAGQMVGILKDVSKDETALFSSLDAYSVASIRYVANRMEQTANQMGLIRSFLLGAIDKVGIIPGLVATALAISKVAQSNGFSWVEILSVALVALYLMMFPIFDADVKLKRISMLLDQYLVLVRKEEGT